MPDSDSKFHITAGGQKWIFDLDQIRFRTQMRVHYANLVRRLHLPRNDRRNMKLNIDLMVQSLDRRQRLEFATMVMLRFAIRDGAFLRALLDQYLQSALITVSLQLGVKR